MNGFAGVLAVALAAVACGGGTPRPSSETEFTEAGIRFEASAGERRLLDGAVREMKSRLGVAYLNTSIMRFDEGGHRFFSFTIPPQTYRSGRVLFVVITLDGEKAEISDFFDTGVPFGPTGVGVAELKDLDRDGLFDVLYCVRVEDDASQLVQAAGFVEDIWYPIRDLQAADRSACEQSGR